MNEILVKSFSLEEVIRQEVENIINYLLKEELTVFLDYEKQGSIGIQMPHDWNGEFPDQTVFSYKHESIQKEAVHITLGIKESGEKEVLDYILTPNKLAGVYEEMLYSMKRQRMEKVQLFIRDGLTELKDGCLKIFFRMQNTRAVRFIF